MSKVFLLTASKEDIMIPCGVYKTKKKAEKDAQLVDRLHRMEEKIWSTLQIDEKNAWNIISNLQDIGRIYFGIEYYDCGWSSIEELNLK